AHDHFVPFHLVYGLPPKLLGHTYWEARADSHVAQQYWEIIDSLRNSRGLHESDRIINQAVPKKAFSLKSNKWIFNNILLARSRRSWREVMEQMRRRRPRGEIQEIFLRQCLEASLSRMYQVFNEDGLKQLRLYDPNGHRSLKEARALRRHLIAKYGTRAAGAREACEVALKKYRFEGAPTF
ncbi:MAG: hypothetical protein V3T77_01520, partial [Planctomycetota bacterium]